MLKTFFEAGRSGLPMPETAKKGTGTMAAIIGGACGATAIVAFSVGHWVFPKTVAADAAKK